MKKLNRVASAILAGLMTVSLCACGGNTGSGNGGNGGSTGTTTVSESGAVVIDVYRDCFNLAAVDDAQVKKVEDAINAYIADKINVQIVLHDIPNADYPDKANLAINNKEVDLLWTAAWMGTVGTKDLYAANAVYDITDLLPGTALYSSMDENTWKASQYGGRNYYIPVYKDNVEGYDFMFRGALVDEFGWDTASVKKLADLEPMLADAKEAGIKYPFLTQKTAMFYRWYIDEFDFFTGDNTSDWVAVDRDTNEVVNTIQTPEYKEFVTLMCKWAEEGYISENEATKATEETTTQTQDWAISWWTDIPNNGEANGRYGQTVVMQPASQRYMHTDSMLGSCFAIAASCTPEEAQACIDFVELLYTDSKLADMYAFGIEGEDFNYNADGYVEKVADAKYNHSMWESASATVVTCEAENPYTAQMYVDFNSSALISCANGFQFDKTPVESQYGACQLVFEEYGFILENGGFASADVDAKLAEYQAALDEAGYQDVLAEFQRQYDEWKK
ncbi:MAG: ABC transporter substrate-binding protein [Lachnospiraceae bacterium]|nr:ABC transporter substrate-binding protein [Lachnospiraceae bacterium]